MAASDLALLPSHELLEELSEAESGGLSAESRPVEALGVAGRRKVAAAATLALAGAGVGVLGLGRGSQILPESGEPPTLVPPGKWPLVQEWFDSIQCWDVNRQMNIDYCDDSKPFSCTPFAFRVFPSEAANGPNTGSYNVPYSCTGNTDYVGDSNDVGIYKAKDADNYFVFHACDGAGVQTDCIGNTYFVEQLGPLTQPGLTVGFNGNEAPGTGEGNSCDLEDDGLHPYGTKQIGCNFQHPGTKMNYDWYWCGWMSTSGWADQSFEWWPTILNDGQLAADNLGQGIPGVQSALGGDPDATLVLYPWVCNKDKTGTRNLDPFTGDSTHNCFCDNNAGDFLGGTVPPPNFKFFALRSDGTGKIRMARVCEYSKGQKRMCNAADDGFENWGTGIEIDSFGSGAW